MASGHGRLAPADSTLKVIYDDLEYGCHDDLTYYLSMRDDERRAEYYRTHKRQDKLQHELDRILKLRTKFFLDPKNGHLTGEYLKAQKDWRNEADESLLENTRELEAKIAEFPNSTFPESETSFRWRYHQNERRILNAVPKWSRTTVPTCPELQASTLTTRDNYGLKACIMHFNIGSGGHTTRSHKEIKGDFPNQKIPVNFLLEPTRDNPLKRKRESDKFRYFHLPSNNMAYIEVIYFLPYFANCFIWHNVANASMLLRSRSSDP